MRLTLGRYLLVAVAAGLSSVAAVACSQTSDASVSEEPELRSDQGETIFNLTGVQDFALDLDTAAMAKMTEEAQFLETHKSLEYFAKPRTHAKGKLTYAGVAYGVDVKIKGSWSAQGFDKKPSLSIDFDDQFLGLKKLTLNSMTQDPTMAREALAYTVYGAVGVAVPRFGYSRLSINGAPYGLYLSLDSIDKTFLSRKYGEKGGIVYEGTYGGDLRESDIGTLNLVHESDKTNPDEEATHTHLKELIAAVTAPGDELFFGPSAIVETDMFVSMMAAAYVIGDWDNYPSANNYRFHRHPTTGRWSIIPTGTDQSLQRSLHPYRPSKGSFSVLFGKCLSSTRCIEAYDAALGKAVQALAEPEALTDTLTRIASLIDTAAAEDPRKPFTVDSMKSARNQTVATLRARPAEIATARSCMVDGHERFKGACIGAAAP